MMKYQPMNYNFIPKDDKDKAESIPPVESKETAVKEEKKAPVTIEEIIIEKHDVELLREQLEFSETQLLTLQNELLISKEKVALLEEQLRKYEGFDMEVSHVEGLNVTIKQLTDENEALKTDCKKNKEHIQMLYFILLIVAIL